MRDARYACCWQVADCMHQSYVTIRRRVTVVVSSALSHISPETSSAPVTTKDGNPSRVIYAICIVVSGSGMA